MPDSAIIPDSLLEPDGVFQNLTIAAGITVKTLQDGKTRLAITDSVAESAMILNNAERLHLINLLVAASASAGTRAPSA